MEEKELQEALKKEEDLKAYFRQLKSVAVAFSGGVDSTYLLKTAHDTLGDQVIAVTAKSCSFPESGEGAGRFFTYLAALGIF